MTEYENLKFTEDDIGCMLFETITKGLYDRPLHAIREYVQNSIEAEPAPSRIDIELEGNTLSILDDGGGMNENQLDEAKKVGISRKDPHKYFGFRGIGIWAGVSLAEKVLITTKRAGMEEWLALEIDAKGIAKEVESYSQKKLTDMLSEHTRLGRVRGNPEEHGTHVQVIGLYDEIMEQFGDKEARTYLRIVLPIELDDQFPHRNKVNQMLKRHVPNYQIAAIRYNGHELRRPPYYDQLEEPLFKLVRGGAGKRGRKENLAYVWSCLNRDRGKIPEEESRKLVYKQFNFTVGHRKSIDPVVDELKHLADWYTGEVHIIHPSIIANASRMNFEPSSQFYALEKALGEYFIELGLAARTKSRTEKLEEGLAQVPSLIDEISELDTIDRRISWIQKAEKLESKFDSGAKKKGIPKDMKREAGKAKSQVHQSIAQVKLAFKETTKGKEAEIPEVEPFPTAGLTETPGGAQSVVPIKAPDVSSSVEGEGIIDVGQAGIRESSEALPEKTRSSLLVAFREAVNQVLNEFFPKGDETREKLGNRILEVLEERLSQFNQAR